MSITKTKLDKEELFKRFPYIKEKCPELSESMRSQFGLGSSYSDQRIISDITLIAGQEKGFPNAWFFSYKEEGETHSEETLVDLVNSDGELLVTLKDRQCRNGPIEYAGSRHISRFSIPRDSYVSTDDLLKSLTKKPDFVIARREDEERWYGSHSNGRRVKYFIAVYDLRE